MSTAIFFRPLLRSALPLALTVSRPVNPRLVSSVLPASYTRVTRSFSLSVPRQTAAPIANAPATAQVQKQAPAWKGMAVVDGELKTVTSDDYKGKYLVLFFYPMDFTFVCPTEIIAFSDRVEEFRAAGCEVVGCSVDSEYSHLAWINTPRNKGGLGEMKIPLLSDMTKSISRSYNVLLEDQGVALRGTFIIGPDGTLRVSLVNDLPIGRSVDEVLRLVEAVKFTDVHGEVCPANWSKGSRTMKADPVKSQEFFSSVYPI
ncbi:C-terminal domain of 1-Cys peroxiredoxin [Gonapodya sp. JEL0774]|nr:C-terminal domain of 1-Cys peroxiredoxin [Gonapodya sp. JEL0774]